jgi:hypothetical protein
MQAENYPNDLADWVYEIPKHIPEGVILQFNFESGVRKTEFGKELIGGDYWLSAPGPSDRFERIAACAKQHNTPVSAKIQTGTAYEVATVPHVPVPLQLYKKFAAMHQLDVTHVMLNWIIGSAPGMMMKAAGELAFAPFPPHESTFMNRLASLYWKEKDIQKVLFAWKSFSEGYAHYPLTNLFQYFGPMSDAPVWPLFLKPQDTILSPTYQLGSRNTSALWPPSGDRIGECFLDVLSLQEVVELCRRMSDSWDRGVKILDEIVSDYADEPERILDINVARATGIQFRSGYNILRFYMLREEMLYMQGRERLRKLQTLISIIQEEQLLSEQLAMLSEIDARLGYHPDAEGYTYFPEKLRWRKQQLQKVLDDDVPEIRHKIENEELLFPEYTGEEPAGAVARAKPEVSGGNLDWQLCEFGTGEKCIKWAASYDADGLNIKIENTSADESTFKCNALIKIEPRRLSPAKIVIQPLIFEEDNPATINIPFQRIGLDKANLRAIRMDVRIILNDGRTTAWRPHNPLLPRLLLGSENPADLGWLIFEQ